MVDGGLSVRQSIFEAFLLIVEDLLFKFELFCMCLLSLPRVKAIDLLAYERLEGDIDLRCLSVT